MVRLVCCSNGVATMQQRGVSMKDGAPKNRLRELRDRSRLTLQEVSTLTGYSVATVSRHEGGSRGLSEEAIAKYAALYKVPTHQLFVSPQGVCEDDED